MKKGFTLIELLIVIAIIAIIAAVTFVALNPLQRFQDSRDASRWTDVRSLLDAVLIDQVDNGGSYISTVPTSTPGEYFMIGSATTGCAVQDNVCDVSVNTTTNCIDLSGLVSQGYLGGLPVSSNGNGLWTSSTTGYVLRYNVNGSVTIQSCESENSTSISVTR